MAKTSSTGLKMLAVAGGVALMLVAWRFPVPLLIARPTTLLSLVSVLYGVFLGPSEASLITALYVGAVILGLPPLLWGGHLDEDPFLAVPTNGLNVGLIAAAFVAAKIAPRAAHSGFGRVALAVLIGHLAYLAVGIAWLCQFAAPVTAATVMLQSQLIPVLAKSVAAFVIVETAGRFVRR